MPNFICTTCGTQDAESDQPHTANGVENLVGSS